MSRILVTGSRAWTDQKRVYEVLESVVEDKVNDVVVHGDCPTGADHFAYLWCIENNVQQERHPAAWGHWGKAAGPRRNQEMVQRGADICVAFPMLGQSRGTADCMAKAEEHGIPVVNMGERYGE